METKVERSPSISAVTVGDGLIVGDFAEGACMALNATASAVWHAIETPATIDEICTALSRRFVIDPADARPEVSRLIADWQARGVVRSLG